MVMGRQWWNSVWWYIAPNDASTIEDIIVSIRRRTQVTKLLVAGDFNLDLAEPEGTMRAEEITASLVDSGLEDMSDFFFLRKK